jgi:crotonobetainyl-CoA:carnitine CoA-transferase CaiB-like acyl-CoA transferase
VKAAAPALGQHTDEVMTGLLGYSLDEVASLRSKGALD